MSDSIVRFLFEESNVRGRVVHLESVWRHIRTRYDYPTVVMRVLGEAVAACAMLLTTIKVEGSVTLQVQSEGPLSFLVVQGRSDLSMRAVAHWREEISEQPLSSLCQGGRMAITIEPDKGKNRYQGLVSLEGDTLAEALEAYFERSEQLPTRLWLAADSERASGMLLQKVPGDEAGDTDLWARTQILAETLKRDELLQLEVAGLLRRLFHEEDVRVFEPEICTFRCRCSREMIRNVITQFGPDEARQMVKEDGSIKAECEFCTQVYEFDSVDVEEIFAASHQPDVPSTRH